MSVWNLILGNNGRGPGEGAEGSAQGAPAWASQEPQPLEATLMGFKMILDADSTPKEEMSSSASPSSPASPPASRTDELSASKSECSASSTASTATPGTMASASSSGAMPSASSSGSLPSTVQKSSQVHPFTEVSVLMHVSCNSLLRNEALPIGAHVPVVRLCGLPGNVSEQTVLAFFAAHDVADRMLEVGMKKSIALLLPASGTASGQAIVWMKTRSDADIVQKALHEKEVENQCIEVTAFGYDDDAMSVDAVETILVPGAKFKGHIFIPGSEKKDEYTLKVLPIPQDLLDLGTIVAHAAYGDEQVCILKISEIDGKKGTFKIAFSDAETFCEGEFSLHSLELKGSVSQVKDGEPGFWFPKKEETHRFELKLEVEGDKLRAQRASEHCIAREVLKNVVWVLNTEQDRASGKKGESEDSSKVQKCWELLFQTAVDWPALWTHAVLQSEEAACKIRSNTEWFSNLKFETEEHKREVLGSLKGPRTRAGCHQCIEQALQRVQVVLGFLIRSVKERIRSSNETQNVDIFRECEPFMHKAEIQRQRLHSAYEAFDRALRSAEARPPRDYYEKSKRKACEEFICSICQVEVSVEEEVIALDCGHSFHVVCAMSWINLHAQCPNCRQSVTKPEDEQQQEKQPSSE